MYTTFGYKNDPYDDFEICLGSFEEYEEAIKAGEEAIEKKICEYFQIF